jgi:5-methylcytosine-specific restriction protein A
MFETGQLYTRQTDIHDKFGGNRQSGIAVSAAHPYIFLFSSPRGKDFGYSDGWSSEDEFLYTGEGQLGDMDLSRGNLAIHDHKANGKELHLFERKGKGKYEYLGQFEYSGHSTNSGQDLAGQQRQTIIFRLKKL